MISKKIAFSIFIKLFFRISNPLTSNYFKKGASLFIGEHDFKNYFCVGTEVNSIIREMFQLMLSIKDFTFVGDQVSGDFVCLEFRGTGFLKQQVRLMVGALLALNEGESEVRGHSAFAFWT